MGVSSLGRQLSVPEAGPQPRREAKGCCPFGPSLEGHGTSCLLPPGLRDRAGAGAQGAQGKKAPTGLAAHQRQDGLLHKESPTSPFPPFPGKLHGGLCNQAQSQYAGGRGLWIVPLSATRSRGRQGQLLASSPGAFALCCPAASKWRGGLLARGLRRHPSVAVVVPGG